MSLGTSIGAGFDVGSAIAYLELNTTGFQQGIQSALSQMSGFGSQLSSKIGAVGASLTSIGSSLTRTITTPIVNGFKTAVTNAMNLEEKLSKVEAVSGATAEDMIKLKKAAQDMALGTKFTTTEVADAMVYMGMAGWDATKIMGGLAGVINLAQASGEDLATVSDIVTDDLTAFGMSAEEAAHFADVLAVASAKSNTNVGLMGESFKFAAPLAGTLGYSIEDIALAMGLMANNSIKGSMAGTSLRSAITRLINPTDEAIGVMVNLGLATEETERIWNHNKIDQKEYQLEQATIDLEKAQVKYNEAVAKYGENSSQAQTALLNVEKAQNKVNEAERKYNIELQGTIETTGINNELLFDSAGNAKNFKEVLVNLRAAFAKLTPEEQASAAATLFGQRAMSGMLAIINSSDEDFNNLVGNLNKSGNAAEDMSKKMMDNLAGSIYELKSALEVLSQVIGDRLSPYIRKAAEWLTNLATKFSQLSTDQIDFAIKVAATVAAIGPLLTILGRLFTTISSVMNIFSAFSGSIKGIATAVGGASGALGGWIALIIACIGYIVYLYNTNEEFRNKMQAIWESVKEKVGGAIEKIAEAVKALEPVLKFLAEYWADYIANFMEAFGGLIEFIAGILEILGGLVKGFTEGDWTMLWEGIKDVFKGALNFLVSFAQGWAKLFLGPFYYLYDVLLGHSIIPDICNGMIQWFTNAFNKTVELISAWVTKIVVWFQELWNKISEWLQNVFEKVEEWFNTIVEKTKEFFENVKNKVVEFFSDVVTKIVDFVSNVISKIVDFFSNLISKIAEFISNVISKVKEFFSNLLQEVIEKTIEIFNKVKDFITNLINTIVDFIKSAWEKISSFIKDVINLIVDFVKNIIEKVKEFFENLLEAIKEKLNAIHDWMKDKFNAIVDFIKSLVPKMYEAGKEMISGLWNGIKEVFGGLLSWAQEKFGAIVDLARRAWDTISSFGGGLFETVGDWFDGSHATGLAYVPYNGYVAQLHEGERVLTKQENRDYTEGRTSGGDTYNIYSYEKLDEYGIRKELEKMRRQLDL